MSSNMSSSQLSLNVCVHARAHIDTGTHAHACLRAHKFVCMYIRFRWEVLSCRILLLGAHIS